MLAALCDCLARRVVLRALLLSHQVTSGFSILGHQIVKEIMFWFLDFPLENSLFCKNVRQLGLLLNCVSALSFTGFKQKS